LECCLGLDSFLLCHPGSRCIDGSLVDTHGKEVLGPCTGLDGLIHPHAGDPYAVRVKLKIRCQVGLCRHSPLLCHPRYYFGLGRDQLKILILDRWWSCQPANCCIDGSLVYTHGKDVLGPCAGLDGLINSHASDPFAVRVKCKEGGQVGLCRNSPLPCHALYDLGLGRDQRKVLLLRGSWRRLWGRLWRRLWCRLWRRLWRRLWGGLGCLGSKFDCKSYNRVCRFLVIKTLLYIPGNINSYLLNAVSVYHINVPALI
jgi:hypothetical protein